MVMLLVVLIAMVAFGLAEMPPPWTRELSVADPLMSGDDVIITQNLLLRDDAVSKLICDGVYDMDTSNAVAAFQDANGLSSTGVVDEKTAELLFTLHSADGIKDDGFTAASLGYMYKIYIPVYTNRSIETSATLYDAYNNVLLTFPVRTHGYRDDGTEAEWPDMGNGDFGLNSFTSMGSTVTGIVELDLNSPEPDPELYGPWPVNRLVNGLAGNAAFLLPSIKNGLLIHTGNWTSAEGGWNPSMAMPNSAGCVHSHPEDVERIYRALVGLGVTVNDNPFSGVDYPYKPQGVAVIQQVD